MLVLVRELTALGAAVAWTGSCADGCAHDRKFFHLFPPMEIYGARESLVRQWREHYLPCMCAFRRGPGFVQVRDRRRGAFEIFTVDDPDTLHSINRMLDAVPAADIPESVRAELRHANLVAEQGGMIWWLPTRIHRWPSPAMLV
jgi:hypothetical protein